MARLKANLRAPPGALQRLIANKQNTARKIQPSPTVIKKSHRWRNGTVALREIRRYQRSTDQLIPKLPFQRLVREIAQDVKNDLRFTGPSMEAVQEAAEQFLTQFLEMAGLSCVHRERMGITKKDLAHVCRMTGFNGGVLPTVAPKVKEQRTPLKRVEAPKTEKQSSSLKKTKSTVATMEPATPVISPMTPIVEVEEVEPEPNLPTAETKNPFVLTD
jgi:histone H3